METISIVALIISSIAVLLLIALIVITLKKSGNDNNIDISQEVVAKITSEVQRENQNTRESVLGGLGLQNTTIQNALNSNRDIIVSSVKSEEERTERMQSNVKEGFQTMAMELKTQLSELKDNNEKQLDKMRMTVDEKLTENLETKFKNSFQMVSDRLDAITKGFGEMQNLTNGMSDLKKVLSNIKTRGTWGEASLDYLLSQMLTPEQYDKNVALSRAENADRVDFVVNLPGKTSEKVLLPIDAKFPIEDYQRIIDADNEVEIAEAKKALAVRIRAEAVSIKNKYIKVPKTTDFAIMYLPIEGLFAEAMQIRGLSDELLNKHRIVMAGPTTLASLLSSLQMGFRSVQIEKRSSEIYKLLGAFKGDFETFCQIIERTQKKLSDVNSEISKASDRTRIIRNKLDKVQLEDGAYEDTLIGGNDEA